ncbi:CarD family transcriptional regulator [Rhodococcus jostii]|uniref:Transcriptional regulator, CarD family n=1 Tax=Rhodococcus jostii TaxID=132919 RepID=A0A1H4WTZ8_RHOJO|nr:CarD family transcriptional regulator [Rhodococcus jostii]SEC96783.1 transcriptional regulator, CarD family [Rhodococcus jostii]
MNLNIGDIFLYPHHGSVTVTKLTTRMFNDLPTAYVQFEVAQNGLSIEIPVAKAEAIGVRNAIGNDEVEQVFDILRGPTVDDPTNWSRRFKANQEKLTVGGIFTVSEVIRDLMTRSQAKPLSAGEKRQLEHAMQLVISELVLAMKSDPDETRRRIEAIYESATASTAAVVSV